jgi:hypothetical protein
VLVAQDIRMVARRGVALDAYSGYVRPLPHLPCASRSLVLTPRTKVISPLPSCSGSAPRARSTSAITSSRACPAVHAGRGADARIGRACSLSSPTEYTTLASPRRWRSSIPTRARARRSQEGVYDEPAPVNTQGAELGAFACLLVQQVHRHECALLFDVRPRTLPSHRALHMS